jgi:hypothetical protein
MHEQSNKSDVLGILKMLVSYKLVNSENTYYIRFKQYKTGTKPEANNSSEGKINLRNKII